MKFWDWIRLAPVFGRSLGKLPLRHLIYMAGQMRFENPHMHEGKMHVNTFFPPYPSKAYDKFLAAVFARRRVPYSVYFAVTDQCPYRCPHCSYGRHVRGHLDTQKAIAIINQIKSIGTVTVGFTGGEPLVRRDIVELVAAIGDDLASVIFSTGYNLDSELAGRLHEAGLDCMTIGMESDIAEEHDAVRGVGGSFQTAVKAIETSLSGGLYTSISTIGSRRKLKDGTLERMAAMAMRYGVHEFRILEPVPTGSFSGNTAEVLTAAESGQLAEFHKQWNRRGMGPSIACFAYLESDAMFGCGAGYHHLFIDALGKVCPCDLTPLAMGNVLEEPLCDIWARMAEWFERPRCGCLMKQLCTDAKVFQGVTEFPVCREKSEGICIHLKHDFRLPKVFANLFKG